MPNNDTGQVVLSAAEVYEEFFVPALFGQWTARVLDAAGIAQGHNVLDVGCGTGVLARTAIGRVGQAGRVVGVDPNQAMLSIARRSEAGIQWKAGVAEALPFENATFDRVVSQFAMMFFTDREGALSEFARVLALGGTVAIATWASLDETPGYATMVELLRDLFGDDYAEALKAPFVLGEVDTVHALMAPYFSDVRVVRHDGVARFESIEAWVHTEIRGWTLADRIDDRQYSSLLDRAQRALARFEDEAGRVTFPASALIATGTSWHEEAPQR